MNRLYRMGCGVIEILASCVLLLVAGLNLVFHTRLIGAEAEMTLHLNGTGYFVSLALWALTALVLYAIRTRLSRIAPGVTFALCALAYVGAAAYGLWHVDASNLPMDSGRVFGAAQDFRSGNFFQMERGRYVGMYPYLLGQIAMTSLVQAVSASPAFFRAMNVGLVLLTNFALWRMAQTYLGCVGAAAHGVILLLFSLLPQLFLTQFVYGNVPGVCLTLLALWAMLAWLQSGGACRAIACVAAITLACLWRTNTLIACIALSSLCVLAFLGRRRVGALALAAAVLLCPLAAGRAVQRHYERASGIPLDSAMPNVTWVTMGMSEGYNMSGWWNGYNEWTSQQLNHDMKAVEAQAMDDLIERLYDFKQEPGLAFDYYMEKVVSTWCEPTFQSIAIHLLDAQEDVDTPLLRELATGTGRYAILYEALHGLMSWCYLLALLHPLLRRRAGEKRTAYALFAQVYVLGGFMFHLLWETKSLYVLCYVLPLMPLAGQSAVWFGRLVTRKFQGNPLQIGKKRV